MIYKQDFTVRFVCLFMRNFHLYLVGQWKVSFFLGHAGAIIAGGKGDAGAKVRRTGLVVEINLEYTTKTVVDPYYIYDWSEVPVF